MKIITIIIAGFSMYRSVIIFIHTVLYFYRHLRISYQKTQRWKAKHDSQRQFLDNSEGERIKLSNTSVDIPDCQKRTAYDICRSKHYSKVVGGSKWNTQHSPDFRSVEDRNIVFVLVQSSHFHFMTGHTAYVHALSVQSELDYKL